MSKPLPPYDPLKSKILRRYELQEDPRKTRLIDWLDSLAAWEIPDLTFEQLDILDLPPVQVEKPKYRQLTFGF